MHVRTSARSPAPPQVGALELDLFFLHSYSATGEVSLSCLGCGCGVAPYYYDRHYRRVQLAGFVYSTRWNESYSGPRSVTLEVNATHERSSCLVQLRALSSDRVKLLGYSVQPHGLRGDSRGGVFGH